MAKGFNQKGKLLILAEILMRETDEEHTLTTAQLIEMLESRGVSCERKSLYDDMETLALHGYDVERRRVGSATGWYIGEREFQAAELRLLVDSIQSSRFITRKKSMELIEKLEKLTSRPQARDFQRQVWVKNRIKSMNESIYYLVDDIHTAINWDRRIRFRYFRYNRERQREFRRGGAFYEVSPFALMWEDENYYLIGYETESGLVKHFRVDKMTALTVTDEKRLGTEFLEKTDMAAYTDSHFGMFSGETTRVRLRFKNELAGAVLDRFGLETMLVPDGEDGFTVTVPAAVNTPFFGWVCSFGGDVRILSPDTVKEQFRQHVERIAGMYGEA